MVMRALQFATSDPKGPVYLSAAREVLEEDIEPYHLDTRVWEPVQPGALPDGKVDEITHALVTAKNPLIITGYLGRNHAAVRELVKLADTLPIRVVDTVGSDMCFPANHRSKFDSPWDTGELANVLCRFHWFGIWRPPLDHEGRHDNSPRLRRSLDTYAVQAHNKGDLAH